MSPGGCSQGQNGQNAWMSVEPTSDRMKLDSKSTAGA